MSENPVVLYVEDDVQSREVMRLLLGNLMGLAHVTIFEDSSDFMSRVQQLAPKPQVILLDIQVYPLDGFEMLRLLRENDEAGFKHVPVVALTASVMNEEIHKLKTAGFDGVISKPLDLDTFPEMLQRILRGEQIWRILN